MKTLLITTLAIFLFLPQTHAGESIPDYCSIAGFYYGMKDEFMGGLAGQVAIEKGQRENQQCSNKWNTALDLGDDFQRTRKLTNKAAEIIFNQTEQFRDSIYKSILKDTSF